MKMLEMGLVSCHREKWVFTCLKKTDVILKYALNALWASSSGVVLTVFHKEKVLGQTQGKQQ